MIFLPNLYISACWLLIETFQVLHKEHQLILEWKYYCVYGGEFILIPFYISFRTGCVDFRSKASCTIQLGFMLIAYLIWDQLENGSRLNRTITTKNWLTMTQMMLFFQRMFLTLSTFRLIVFRCSVALLFSELVHHSNGLWTKRALLTRPCYLVRDRITRWNLYEEQFSREIFSEWEASMPFNLHYVRALLYDRHIWQPNDGCMAVYFSVCFYLLHFVRVGE